MEKYSDVAALTPGFQCPSKPRFPAGSHRAVQSLIRAQSQVAEQPPPGSVPAAAARRLERPYGRPFPLGHENIRPGRASWADIQMCTRFASSQPLPTDVTHHHVYADVKNVPGMPHISMAACSALALLEPGSRECSC